TNTTFPFSASGRCPWSWLDERSGRVSPALKPSARLVLLRSNEAASAQLNMPSPQRGNEVEERVWIDRPRGPRTVCRTLFLIALPSEPSCEPSQRFLTSLGAKPLRSPARRRDRGQRLFRTRGEAKAGAVPSPPSNAGPFC